MSEADDDRIKRVGEILDALKAQTLPADELARLGAELDEIGQVLDFEPMVEVVMSEMEAFIHCLKHRQGSIFPDYQKLYKRKAELDRKLLGPA